VLTGRVNLPTKVKPQQSGTSGRCNSGDAANGHAAARDEWLRRDAKQQILWTADGEAVE
jgi:hypothetical protein